MEIDHLTIIAKHSLKQSKYFIDICWKVSCDKPSWFKFWYSWDTVLYDDYFTQNYSKRAVKFYQ